EAAVDLHLAAIIEPRHAEHKDSFRLRNAFQNFGFVIFGVALQHRPQGFEYFENGLMKFWFGWVFGFDEIENLVGVVRRRIRFGRFHDMTHRLASEIFSYHLSLSKERIVKTQDAADPRLWQLNVKRGRPAVILLTDLSDARFRKENKNARLQAYDPRDSVDTARCVEQRNPG